jgi:hypothetical protein
MKWCGMKWLIHWGAFGSLQGPMKKSLLWFVLLVMVGVWTLNARAAEPSDPSDQFLNAYFRIQEGDKAESQGNWALAHQRYTAALGILNTVKTQSPNWNPHIIEFRIGYCNEHLAALKPRLSTRLQRSRCRPWLNRRPQ